MNRRRPRHQRIVRKVFRHAPHVGSIRITPLSVLSGIHLLGGLAALLFGSFAVALVFVAGTFACVACHFRRPSDILL